MFDLEKELMNLPHKPGVYIMKDSQDSILYIGKAIVLKNRVRQYFQSSANHTPRIKTMVSKIDHFEYIVTNSELEALILECNLIKEHKPRFNVLLKDDKTYPYIKITENEDFPRIFMTRKVFKDGAKYFGPYTDVLAVRDILNVLKKIFPIRMCEKELPREIGKGRACLNFHINQCLAPCQSKVDSKAYKNMIKEVYDFLDGKYENVIGKMEQEMNAASENMDFEKAAVLRDRIAAAYRLMQKQKITQTDGNEIDIDIIGMARGVSDVCIQVFFVRNGKLINRENFMLKSMNDVDDTEILSAFIKQFYGVVKYIPKLILLDYQLSEANLLQEWLSAKRNSKVEIRVPQKGDKRNLLQMANKNAEIELERHGIGYETALNQLAELLNMDKPIGRIEAYDISNLSGTSVVGCMVVFEGRFEKRQYKRFKIKTVKGQNDVECMKEVVGRRIRRALNDEKSKETFGRLPDLILLDGGKQQVNAVAELMASMNVDLLAVGMVKDNKHRTRGLVLKDGQEVILKDFTQAFKLVSEIQEEVHRFALDFHTKLRKKESMKSELDEIKGVGITRKRQLFKHFGSIEAVKKASIEQLEQVKGLNKVSAKAVYDHFHK